MSELTESEKETIDKIAGHYQEILKLVGENADRQGLVDTPQRAAKALWYLTRGYRQNVESVIHNAMFDAPSSDLIVVRDIEFYSLCEHHILPFFGTVSVGYVPGDRIVGLSKIARIVDMFARRLQVQERFSNELCQTLMLQLKAKGVIVRCRAHHLCMQMRGVEKQSSTTVTLSAEGILRTDEELRNQFFHSIL